MATEPVLADNGLTGKANPVLAELTSLEVLNLKGNGMNVCVGPFMVL